MAVKKRKRRLSSTGKFIIFLAILLVVIFVICQIIVKNKAHAPESTKVGADLSSSSVQKEKSKVKTRYAVKTDSTQKLDIESEFGILIDVDKNEIVAQKSGDTVIYPASMTKVMTLIIAVENMKSLDDTFTYTSEIIDPLFRDEATMAGFMPDESVTVKDMLYGTILPSGADAAAGLAIKIAGSEREFVKLMNEKVNTMGLKNTHFVNTSGLHDPYHFTTCHDMALIMKYAMKNRICREILSAVTYKTASTPQNPEGIVLESTMYQKMFGTEAEGVKIIGGKTGYTDQSGNCLVSFAEAVDGKKYVMVSAKAPNQWSSTYDTIYSFAKHVGTKNVYLPSGSSGPTSHSYSGIKMENKPLDFFN